MDTNIIALTDRRKTVKVCIRSEWEGLSIGERMVELPYEIYDGQLMVKHSGKEIKLSEKRLILERGYYRSDGIAFFITAG